MDSVCRMTNIEMKKTITIEELHQMTVDKIIDGMIKADRVLPGNPLQYLCFPGDRLCQSGFFKGGRGTVDVNGFISATVCGYLAFKHRVISVNPINSTTVPAAGDIVTCRVTQIYLRYVKCLILATNDIKMKIQYTANLRKEDIYATNKDRTEISKCYRPNDIILARVLPSEANTFFLSTAENELGVAVARVESHLPPMVPISWEEMQCPVTMVKEKRKVARIVAEDAIM